MNEKAIIRKISKGRQNRVTIPKQWSTEYVVLKPLVVDNVFKIKKRYLK